MARLALSKVNLTSSEANLRDAEINYKRYTGIAPDILIKTDGPKPSDLPSSSLSAFEQARSSNPLMKLAVADIDAANTSTQLPSRHMVLDWI